MERMITDDSSQHFFVLAFFVLPLEISLRTPLVFDSVPHQRSVEGQENRLQIVGKPTLLGGPARRISICLSRHLRRPPSFPQATATMILL